MKLISLVNRLLPECSYKLFVPIVFGILLYATKSIASENFDVDYVEGEIRTVEGISFCDESLIKERGLTKRLLFISTLDGGVTALDLTKDGQILWDISTGELLSSSIHQMEMTNQGKSVRMIPSLNGGIYKFDGESVEAIPVNAEDLLKSSFKFKDDIVMSGNQEVKTYGVNCRTGQVVYEHPIGGTSKKKTNDTSDKDSNKNENSPRTTSDLVLDDILVVRRFSQTVRANEPRSGEERWNFSIGHHEMQVDLSDNCHKNGESDMIDRMIHDTEIRVIIPEGIIVGYNKYNPNVILWKHKFNSPIVSVFRSDENNQLHNVDLFANSRWLWEEHGNQYFVKASGDSKFSPSLYLGIYNQQYYIQESNMMKSTLDNIKKQDQNLVEDESRLLKIPFKPIPASNNALIDFVSKFNTKIENISNDNDDEKKEIKDLIKIDDQLLTAQAVFLAPSHAEGRGFYLFSSKDINETTQCKKTKSTNQSPQDFDNITFQNEKIHPVRLSLWFYWKEILVIALSTALIINIMLRNQNRRGEREVVFVPIAKEAIEYDDESEELKKKHLEIEMLRNEAQAKLRSLSESGEREENYKSRFLEDFDLVRCLGKGGFGVVFEARNKLDDCTYAIKRIILPSKQESRERVLREVKTLANCEHHNIVRYFHAWVEQPPKGWQELKDKEMFSRDVISTSITIDSPSPTEESKAFSTYTDNKLTSYDYKASNNKTAASSNDWLMNIQNKSFPDFSENNKLIDESEFDDSCIEFKADTSDDENDIKDNYKDNTSIADESFAIEFRESTRTVSLSDMNGGESDVEKSHVISISDETSISKSTQNDHKKKHRRNLSLDLATNANDMLPKKLNTIGANSSKIYLFIQMQLCMKSSLKDWLKETDLKARNGETVNIWHQIIDAVHYVHLKGLIHRDLKPSNIFFALDGKIKIGDFGLVTDMAEIPFPDPLTSSSSNSNSSSNFDADFVFIGSKKHTQRVGTSLYMSPEQARGGAYNYKVDIYSLGLIFFELLNFFYTETERYKVLQDIKNQKYPNSFINEFKNEFELLKMMLAKCPEERPTTFGIRARPPLNKVDNELSSTEWHFELPTRRRDSFRSINNLNGK
ncbi:hypothetical protein PVAND_009619 [Polypedilum vanderplanki]|uniref:non-specific serine/threonine protein kinase n=1 Tax=Polypedilum vanderplanki TaxID=319348 RepID=A0A9J6CDT9_POLVA|nr:hypothetical protein PVAND_009619 [Polypedilum vanderplanki]